MHLQVSDQPRFDIGFGGYTGNWGMHLAGLYETEAQRDEILFGFLRAGFDAGDLQLYCPTERTEADFRQQFACTCPHCNLDDPNQIEFFTARELYYPDGVFSPWTMEMSLNSFFIRSQRRGRRNVRGAAEMAWALDDLPGVWDLMAYESRLNYFIPGKPWVSLCLYNLARFDGDAILGILQTHPYTISNGVITENPFYQDPDQWLAENAPNYLSSPATSAD